jgi:hypothetical protein
MGRSRWIAALVVATALVAAACGSSGEEIDSTNAEPPAAADACTSGQPGCEDTDQDDEDDGSVAPDESPPEQDSNTGASGGAVASGGQTVNGGLTVSEALSTDATGILAVQGNLFDDGSGLRLCEVLAESFPPQCPEPAIPIQGLETDDIPDLLDTGQAAVQMSQGVTWTDAYITLFGELIDGALVVDLQVIG